MKIAVAQFSPKFKKFSENLEMMMRLVLEAANNGAELIVLPELCTTGYSFMSYKEAEPFSETLEGPAMQFMQKLSGSHRIAIGWGFIRKDLGTDALYNSQVLVLPDGRWSYVDKLNLWANDYLYATEGKSSPPIIDYLGKKVGLLICRDVRDKAPGFKDFYEAGDADVVCFSSNFGDGGFPAVNWVEFAKGNKVWFAVSNRYGKEENNNFGEGGICVIEPSGKVHCDGLRWNQPCIVYADIP